MKRLILILILLFPLLTLLAWVFWGRAIPRIVPQPPAAQTNSVTVTPAAKP